MRLDGFGLFVNDMGKMIRFYRDVLGFEIKEGKVIKLDKVPSSGKNGEGEMYIMAMTQDGAVDTYYLPMQIAAENMQQEINLETVLNAWKTKYDEDHASVIAAGVAKAAVVPSTDTETARWGADQKLKISDPLAVGRVVYVDYYVEADKGVKQIDIEAGKFGGSYYLEASTLFRDQRGVDMPAEFIIPNCKIQSNFTFTMASSGDPSTFTFTMDAFPDYTRFDHSKKVLAAIQIIKTADSEDLHRHSTAHEAAHDALTWN